MTEVNMTEAMKLAGLKGRQTLYTAKERGELTVLGSKHNQRIDVAELERWVKAKYDRPLKMPKGKGAGALEDDLDQEDSETSESSATLIAEGAMLKERLAQTERRFREEKESLVDQIDFLKERIEKGDTERVQLTALLEDHRKGRSRAESRVDETKEELVRRMAQREEAFKKAMKKRTQQHDRELKRAWTEGASLKGLWQRLWHGSNVRQESNAKGR